MKICVIISSHSPSVYTKLTIATLLRTVGKNHELNIHIGVHSNYKDYTNDFSLFEELKGLAQIHCVDEIDWVANTRNNYRYSLMHSKNMENLLKNVKYYDFDYLIILDNDLYIKSDFISLLTSNEKKYDLIYSYFNKDIKTIYNERSSITGEYNVTIQFMPRLTNWNVILSRKLYDRIMEDTSILYVDRITDNEKISYYKNFLPEIDEQFPIVFDTLAKINFHANHIWNDITIKEVEDDYMKELIKHFFGSSFNYGSIIGNTEGEGIVTNIYNKEFPNGLKNLKM
jgi:hypothetical protein